ncbi:enoyl-CoA hydratase family protein [Catenulispora pinistramenti]|uniref:enoyl-CoA hydratase family protein n=1 Tax=Catenulispora pinistramenti TaxID=2705254 RepID=UPI002E76E904|nr:enoyl-CoA hydratase family protein [Catenulispora pinistramenti]
MSEQQTLVRYEAQAGVATLTLDSPRNRNALSSRLVAQLHAGLREAAADPGVRAVVLGHTGNTFCAGADLSEATGEPVDPEGPVAGRARALAGLLRALVELPKPVVAAVDGHVRAGGMGLVAACDLAVAGPAATFALTEARLGVAPSIISLTVLPRLSSRAATRYFLTGEKFDAAQAEAIGLITVAAQDVRAAVGELVAALRLGSPQGLAESKKLVTAPVLAAFDAHADELATASARLFASEEAREGMTAFLQKRPPSWAE